MYGCVIFFFTFSLFLTLGHAGCRLSVCVVFIFHLWRAVAFVFQGFGQWGLTNDAARCVLDWGVCLIGGWGAASVCFVYICKCFLSMGSDAGVLCCALLLGPIVDACWDSFQRLPGM